MGMFMKAVRLLEYQQRLERAEALGRGLQSRLREQPDQEELRSALRIANREILMARQALMEVIVESSESTVSPEPDDPRGDGGQHQQEKSKAA